MLWDMHGCVGSLLVCIVWDVLSVKSSPFCFCIAQEIKPLLSTVSSVSSMADSVYVARAIGKYEPAMHDVHH